MEDKKEPYYLISTDWKKKAENIIKEYLKRFWIEEKHRRDKSILKLEGNYLRVKEVITALFCLWLYYQTALNI